MCDYAFGKGLCCGGEIDSANTLYTDMCGFYDCFTNDWEPFHDLPKKLTHASATVVRGEYGRDIGWLVSGGQGKRQIFLRNTFSKKGNMDLFPNFLNLF